MFSKSPFFDPISSFFNAITQTDRPNSKRLDKPRLVRPFAGIVALSHEVGWQTSLFQNAFYPIRITYVFGRSRPRYAARRRGGKRSTTVDGSSVQAFSSHLSPAATKEVGQFHDLIGSPRRPSVSVVNARRCLLRASGEPRQRSRRHHETQSWRRGPLYRAFGLRPQSWFSERGSPI